MLVQKALITLSSPLQLIALFAEVSMERETDGNAQTTFIPP